jgi:outer membrane protein TolC
MNASRILALLPIVLSLAACMTVGPDYTLPKDAAINAPLANAPLDGTDIAQVSQEAVPSNWWRLYDDPVLDGLIRDALKSNTDLRVAAANLARAHEAVGVEEAQGGFSGSASAAVKRAQAAGEQFLLFEGMTAFANNTELHVHAPRCVLGRY